MFVLKCGGSTLDQLQDSFYDELIQLKQDGFAPVIVHGGGPAISSTLAAFGVEAKFVNGLRVTDEATLKVVEMILIGQTNKQIVKRLKGAGFGFSGIDGQIIEAKQMDPAWGWVGTITRIQPEPIHQLSKLGFIPVISPVGIDHQGQSYNINADTAAGALASALGVGRLLVVTDVPGVMKGGAVLPELTVSEVKQFIASEVIYGGMIPKVQAAIDALEKVQEVLIINPESLQQAVRGEPVGTKIIKG
jgi:acetylglutamate kinase